MAFFIIIFYRVYLFTKLQDWSLSPYLSKMHMVCFKIWAVQLNWVKANLRQDSPLAQAPLSGCLLSLKLDFFKNPILHVTIGKTDFKFIYFGGMGEGGAK